MINTSANVVISKANEVFLRVNAEPHIEYELRDYFTADVSFKYTMYTITDLAGNDL